MAEEYFEEDDPKEFVMSMYVQRVVDYALLGPTETVPQGSLLAAVADASKGIALEMLLAQSPNAARATARLNVAGRAQEGSDSFPRGLGSGVSEAANVRMPGVGMPVTQAPLPALR
jgi:hypothetical protein